ncbi:SRPBCC family protein [Pedobacter sp. KR3-3]|uniref:SRPBCC family protein n=1 Tax=Pedobacter albus TaxID=3113905 RepID=A0ABU7I7S5_9SPHI|nr:SRPBCC family protein [Pedobacter sp. KR3-3]MEE1945439.1 SRPBCC family protein [Pedobacter sp. KR3-3]
MKSYQLTFKQRFPISLENAWDFFSSPMNLAQITPSDMAFIVTSKQDPDEKMYAGMIITYKVSPLLGIKLNWMTEITQVAQEKYFIDEQRFGPFKFWHHQHHFRAIPNGVEMTDILTYGLPLGIFGQMAHGLFVRKRLKEIFDFRKAKTTELFGVMA